MARIAHASNIATTTRKVTAMREGKELRPAPLLDRLEDIVRWKAARTVLETEASIASSTAGFRNPDDPVRWLSRPAVMQAAYEQEVVLRAMQTVGNHRLTDRITKALQTIHRYRRGYPEQDRTIPETAARLLGITEQ